MTDAVRPGVEARRKKARTHPCPKGVKETRAETNAERLARWKAEDAARAAAAPAKKSEGGGWRRRRAARSAKYKALRAMARAMPADDRQRGMAVVAAAEAAAEVAADDAVEARAEDVRRRLEEAARARARARGEAEDRRRRGVPSEAEDRRQWREAARVAAAKAKARAEAAAAEREAQAEVAAKREARAAAATVAMLAEGWVYAGPRNAEEAFLEARVEKAAAAVRADVTGEADATGEVDAGAGRSEREAPAEDGRPDARCENGAVERRRGDDPSSGTDARRRRRPRAPSVVWYPDGVWNAPVAARTPAAPVRALPSAWGHPHPPALDVRHVNVHWREIHEEDPDDRELTERDDTADPSPGIWI